MVCVEGKGTPLGVCVEKASPAEVKLLERTRDAVNVRLNRSFRAARTTRSRPIKMGGALEDINVEGVPRAPIRGCKTSGDWWCGMSTRSRTLKPLSISPVLESHSKGVQDECSRLSSFIVSSPPLVISLIVNKKVDPCSGRDSTQIRPP